MPAPDWTTTSRENIDNTGMHLAREGQYIDIIIVILRAHDNHIVVVLQFIYSHIIFTLLVVLLHEIRHTLPKM